MALVVENNGEDNADSLTSFAFDLGFVPTDGRLLIAFISKNESSAALSITSNDGWTQLSQALHSSAVTSVWWKVASSESQIHTWSGNQGRWAGGVIEVSGQNAGTPINTSSSATGTSASADATTITPSIDNCLIVSGVGVNNNIAITVNTNYLTQCSGDCWNIAATTSSIVATAGGTLLQTTAAATTTVSHTLGSSTDWFASNIAIAPVTAGPEFIRSDQADKVGAIISVDANNWYTSSGGTLDTFADVGASLPAGLSIHATTGIISGTLSETAGTINVSITASDDNGTTQGDFDWVITNYELIFTGTTKLLNTSNSPYNPTTTVSFSAVKGTIDTNLTTVVEFPTETVTDGVVTLNSASLTSGTWTVFAQDDTDGTILGVYEIVAE